MMKKTFAVNIPEIRELIENKGYYRTEAQSKNAFKKHLEDEGTLSHYYDMSGKLERKMFNNAYEKSSFSKRSVQHFYNLTLSQANSLFKLEAIKNANIRKSRDSADKAELKFVIQEDHSDTLDMEKAPLISYQRESEEASEIVERESISQ